MSNVELSRDEFSTANDGLLELSPERLRSLIRSEPIRDVYHVEETPFARGKFASVKKVRHLETGIEYAAKMIRKRRRDAMREIQHEVAVLALCAGTPRVVKLHEVYDSRTEVAIVLELASGGELQRVLDEEERLSEAAARRAMRHVLEGLAHLHARRVAHLDLKPQNLLLDAATGDLCLCDFGISRAIQPGAVVREILGTRDYVAPEILSYEPISLAADVWSVGVLAYVLLSGYSPFAGATKQETYLNIAQCSLSFPEELFADVSDTAIAFIKDTLVLEPKGRLTVEQCLEHPWLQDEEPPAPAPPPPAPLKEEETNGHDGEDKKARHCVASARESAPFPDAPSTPKVSRKSHPPPARVRQLCKKFQPEAAGERERKPLDPLPLALADNPCACGHPCLRHPRPPDRAILC